MAHCKSCQKGNGVKQGRTVGSLSQGESQRYQDDQPGIKKHRHGDHQTCDPKCPGRFLVPKPFHHGDRKALGASRRFQDRAEHGTQSHQKRYPFQRITNSIIYSRYNIFKRHSCQQANGDCSDQNRNHRLNLKFNN